MHGATVLIVDDEPVARQTFAEWLKAKRFRVIEAENGIQAMERLRKDPLDIVISDRVMAGMGGLELLREVRTSRIDVPFVMITGYPSHTAALEAMREGASDFLAKPFSPEELTRRVNRALLQKALDRRLAPAEGVMLGMAVSATIWGLVIWALSALLP